MDWIQIDKKQLAGLLKDVNRYHHLRSKSLDTIEKGGVFAGLTPDNAILNGKDLDDAIDKEMSEA